MITKMNGKPFTHFTYVDFGQPGRKTSYGSHTSLRTAQNHLKRMLSWWSQGRIWIEDAAGNVVGGNPPSNVRRTLPEELVSAAFSHGRRGTYRVLKTGELLQLYDIQVQITPSGDIYLDFAGIRDIHPVGNGERWIRLSAFEQLTPAIQNMMDEIATPTT